MKTIKIIDLLNKIATGEDVPKKIKYIGYIFEYDTNHERYEAYIGEEMYTLNYYVNIDEDLTYEAEIIEEEKKLPEKLGVCAYVEGEIAYSWSKSEAVLKTKINEILDYLESKEKGE